jgi:acyl carrier protein
MELLFEIINTVRINKGLKPIPDIKPVDDLRTVMGFDSLDLAELTVRVEKEFGVDIFADSFVLTVGDIIKKLSL